LAGLFVDGCDHCDEYIKGENVPQCLVDFVSFYRQPASDRSDGVTPPVFARRRRLALSVLTSHIVKRFTLRCPKEQESG